MQFSIIQYKNLYKRSRLDAEFYLPEYLLKESVIKSKRHKKLVEISESIINFGAYSLCNYIKFTDNKGVPYLNVGDIKHNYIDFSNVKYIKEELSSNILKKSLVKENQILITIAGTIGNVAVATNIPEHTNSNQAIANITLNKYISPFYISTFLNSKYGIFQTKRLIISSVQPNLLLTQVKEIDIVLLEYDFQLFIEQLVKSAHHLSTLSQQKYSAAEALLLSELGLEGWEPKHTLTFVRNYSDAKAAGRCDAEYFQPKYDEIIDKIKNYKNGKWDYLKNIVKYSKSIEPGSNEYKEEGIAFVRVSNLGKFEINDNNQKYISESFYLKNIKYQPKKGDILLSKDATPGIAYNLKETPKKMIVSGGILRLDVWDKNTIAPEVLTLVLNSLIVEKQMKRDIGGSVILHWRPDQIENIIIPLFDDKIQTEIKQKVEESFEMRDKSKKLLEIAKLGVEKAIEEDEDAATAWIDEELKKLNIDLKDTDMQ